MPFELQISLSSVHSRRSGNRIWPLQRPKIFSELFFAALLNLILVSASAVGVENSRIRLDPGHRDFDGLPCHSFSRHFGSVQDLQVDRFPSGRSSGAGEVLTEGLVVSNSQNHCAEDLAPIRSTLKIFSAPMAEVLRRLFAQRSGSYAREPPNDPFNESSRLLAFKVASLAGQLRTVERSERGWALKPLVRGRS